MLCVVTVQQIVVIKRVLKQFVNCLLPVQGGPSMNLLEVQTSTFGTITFSDILVGLQLTLGVCAKD